MKQDYKHLSQQARYSITRLAQEVQTEAQKWARDHRREPEAAGMFLAVYRLGVALENYAKLNGHMEIWATFTPMLPDFESDDTEYGRIE